MDLAAPTRNQRVGERSTTSGDPAGAHRDSPSPTLKQGRPAPTRIRGSPGGGSRCRRPLHAPLAEASRL